MKKIIIILIVLMVILFGWKAIIGEQYAGRFWFKIPNSQKWGWVDGFAECSIFELRNSNFENVYIDEMVEDVNHAYTGLDDSRRKRPVSKILIASVSNGAYKSFIKNEHRTSRNYNNQLDFDDAVARNPSARGRLTVKYWKKFPMKYRLGYIQGYSTCKSDEKSQKRFSTSPSTRLQQVNFCVYESSGFPCGLIEMNTPVSSIIATLISNGK